MRGLEGPWRAWWVFFGLFFGDNEKIPKGSGVGGRGGMVPPFFGELKYSLCC